MCVSVGVRVICELCWSEVVMDRVGCSTCGRASNLLRDIFGDDGIFDTTTPRVFRTPPVVLGKTSRIHHQIYQNHRFLIILVLILSHTLLYVINEGCGQ